MNTLSYVVSLTEIIVQAAHHVANLHFDSSMKVWNVTQNHTSLIRPLLALSPSVYRTVVESFSDLNLTEVGAISCLAYNISSHLTDLFNPYRNSLKLTKTLETYFARKRC